MLSGNNGLYEQDVAAMAEGEVLDQLTWVMENKIKINDRAKQNWGKLKIRLILYM